MFQVIKSLLFTKQFSSFLVLLLLSSNGYTFNNNQSLAAPFIDKAGADNLWTNPEWLSLLHYNKNGDGYLSQVDDDRFFYALNGKNNPQDELNETLRQLFVPTENHNLQTQCRFIARSEWLLKQLRIDRGSLPRVRCSEFQEWYELARADSVTMVFPAYHLNSPSSMFGHTLLRLDKSEIEQSEWVSFAVNFGADTNNTENSIMYAYRGLAGGYPGLFITEPYFKKIQEYNRIEHRDIWEYKLNLTAEETLRIIKHLWELKTINFDYYFFDENCSYRLLELIEVARPGIELTDEFKLTAIPVDTIRAIEKAGLIESVQYRPAQTTKIQFLLNQLPEEQRVIVLQLSQDISISKTAGFLDLSAIQQKKVADLSYKYLRYQNSAKARDPVIVKRSYQLLQLVNSYPSEISVESNIPAPVQPEKSHRSKRVSMGFGERLDNAYLDLGFKMSFHDLEDNRDGFLEGAQINLGSINLRIEENRGLRLHQFDVVDIFSLTPRNAFFQPLSWKIYTGLERQLTNNRDKLVYHVTGGAGGTWELTTGHQFHALATLRLEMNKQMKNAIEPAAGFNTGFLSHFKDTTARLEFSGEKFEDSTYRVRVEYKQNFVLSTNHSIKLSLKNQWQDSDVEFSDVNLNYQVYF